MIKGHGGNIYELADEFGCLPSDIIDMSSNINPLGPPAGLMDHLKNHIEVVNALPEADAKASVNAFAERYDIDSKRVLAGNGTTQFVYSLPMALQTTRALIIGPTYADYADGCAMHHVPVDFMFSDQTKDFIPEFSEIDRHLEGIDTVFICNSNNPTGVTVSHEALVEIFRNHSEIRWIVDESYLPFADPDKKISMLSRNLPNVIILSSLSKIFRIPGLRIGFVTSSENIIQSLSEYAMPWNVNSLSQVAVEYLMKNTSEVEAFVRNTSEFLNVEKKIFSDTFANSPHIRFFPSTTSFLLGKLSKDFTAKNTCRFFAKQRILLRDCSNFNGLSNRFIRISLKSRAINENVAYMLLNYLEGQGDRS
jgi:threonine-phosphate decarboxylase